MKVLWHEDMSVNHKAKPAAGFFRDFQDKVTAFGGAQLGLTVVAGGNKMQLRAVIVAMKSLGHPIRVGPGVRD
jgi:hypothetical protein